MYMKSRERIGETRKMSCGDYAKIIKYNNVNDVIVEFQDDHHYMCTVEYWNFARGHVKNPYHKNKYGGYIGVGDYKVSENRKGTYIYDAWIRMLERSYGEKFKERYPAYNDVTCCNEWLCFQNFAKWYEEHYYKVDGQSMEVDKDWIKFGNKVYCPEFCEVVPGIINSCMLNHDKIKNHELPTGITYHNNKYQARLSVEGKRMDLGHYSNLSDAMNAYKNAKIQYVKYLAGKYKQYIPEIVYNNMMNFDERFDKEFPEYAEI